MCALRACIFSWEPALLYGPFGQGHGILAGLVTAGPVKKKSGAALLWSPVLNMFRICHMEGLKGPVCPVYYIVMWCLVF